MAADSPLDPKNMGVAVPSAASLVARAAPPPIPKPPKTRAKTARAQRSRQKRAPAKPPKRPGPGAPTADETPRILERQFQAYQLRLTGYTIDEIAIALKVSVRQISADLKAEGAFRAQQLVTHREEEIARSLSFLDTVTKRLIPATGALDAATAAVLLKANEQRNKILGLEAPKRIDVRTAAYAPGTNPLEGLALDARRLLLQRAAARLQNESASGIKNVTPVAPAESEQEVIHA